jgi:hypothetical protein
MPESMSIWTGRIEIPANGVALPRTPCDKLSEINQGAVIDHKPLSHFLQVAQMMQADRDGFVRMGMSSHAADATIDF